MGETARICITFLLGNLVSFFLSKELEFNSLFFNSLAINFSILIVYIEFYSLISRGFTLSIITTFKNKKKISEKKLSIFYANGRGAKWLLLKRLKGLNKIKVLQFDKNMKLTKFGNFLCFFIIIFRKVFFIKDFV